MLICRYLGLSPLSNELQHMKGLIAYSQGEGKRSNLILKREIFMRFPKKPVVGPDEASSFSLDKSHHIKQGLRRWCCRHCTLLVLPTLMLLVSPLLSLSLKTP